MKNTVLGCIVVLAILGVVLIARLAVFVLFGVVVGAAATYFAVKSLFDKA